ncbi:GNAT family N-acetyltransferase [Nocardioides rubriscoriae]|uniref:GNAT family N-acetyltransferase n=1 Tax=Nocardioides rubriscoriae TaxID=642762 RepID=UPI001B868838|nr:GNAT family N-acetyltransferase [Nocardioides rubriscoriae]
MSPTDVTLRRAGVEDAAAVTRVHLASRRAAPMPPGVHGDREVEAWLTTRLTQDEVWVAEADDTVVAYARLTDTWLDDLYVLPEHAGRGIGSMLLDLAKALRPDGFSLWVFESNTAARAFYARHGLVEREHTDGSDNEEKAPDLRMSWAE